LPATGGDETDDGAPVSVHELMPTLVDGLATARDTGLDAASAGWLWDWLGQRALVTAAASRTAAIDRLIERFAAAGAHQGASAS
jgi:hypothetical protein